MGTAALSFFLGGLRVGIGLRDEGTWVLELGVLVIAFWSRVLGAGADTLGTDISEESSIQDMVGLSGLRRS